MKHFSKEEIDEIRQRLAGEGVRDTDFTEASTFSDDDKIAIVQDTKNKIVSGSVLSDKFLDDHKSYIKEQTDSTLSEAKSYTDSTVSEAVQTEKEERQSEDSSIRTALKKETTDRTSDTKSLQGNIDKVNATVLYEQTARAKADAALQESIITETNNRSDADNVLQENIKLTFPGKSGTFALVDDITTHNSASDSHSDIRNLITNYFNILMDGVFIMFHRKSDNFPLIVKPDNWASYQNSGEIAEGVVVVEGGKILVVAPTEPNYLYWSSADVSGGGKTTTDRLAALDDWTGKASTAAQITHSECNTASYAPGYCALYSRVNANGEGLTAGRWWLPSLGELMMIYANMRKINYALSLIEGATQLAETWYWSSTEYSAGSAWGLYLDGGGAGYDAKASSQKRVRAVSAFSY